MPLLSSAVVLSGSLLLMRCSFWLSKVRLSQNCQEHHHLLAYRPLPPLLASCWAVTGCITAECINWLSFNLIKTTCAAYTAVTSTKTWAFFIISCNKCLSPPLSVLGPTYSVALCKNCGQPCGAQAHLGKIAAQTCPSTSPSLCT